jgi:hypothetical protein
MAMDEREMQRFLGQGLGLHGSEAETMMAVIRRCAVMGGLPLGATGAYGLAATGPHGWLIGFAAGFASGTLICTMAQRGVVVEALKQTIGHNRRRPVSEPEALAELRRALGAVQPQLRMTPRA